MLEKKNKFCMNEIDKQLEEICARRGYIFSVMFFPPNHQFNYSRYMIWFSEKEDEEKEFDEFLSLPDAKINFLNYILKLERKFEYANNKKKQETKPIKSKNPDAVALGRLGGLKGGKARFEKLTPKERTEIAKKGAKARWGKRIDYDYMA